MLAGGAAPDAAAEAAAAAAEAEAEEDDDIGLARTERKRLDRNSKGYLLSQVFV